MTWHPGDSAGGRARWKAAVAKGMLRPEECPAHALGDAARWTSYGPFGVASAWTVSHLGRCVGPEALDTPRAAAQAAVAWAGSLCRRYGACTCEDRTMWWVGPGVWADRSRLAQIASIERQCGELPWWRWTAAAAVDVVMAYGAALEQAASISALMRVIS